MSVCFLARHLASLKSQRHAQRTQACTHTQTHSHAHRLWRALTFIILWMSGTYSSYTWYLNCAHYSNCCLQFANIFSCWVAETERRGGGALSIGTRSAHFEALKTALAHPGNAYINRCDENLKKNFGNFFAADLFSLFLPLPPSASPSSSAAFAFYLFYNFLQLF